MSRAALAEDAVAVRRLRARGVAESVLRRQLAAVPTPRLRPFIFVRRVRLRAGPGQIGRAMEAALARLAADGTAETLAFPDLPALTVACARAALGGGLAGWHWRTLGLPRLAGPGEAVAALLTAHPREAGSAVAALAAQGLLGPVWRDLSAAAAGGLTASLVQAAGFALPPWPDQAAAPAADPDLPAAAAPLLARAAAFWAPVLAPLPPRAEAVRTACVLALLRWSPGVLRGTDGPVWPALLARIAGQPIVPRAVPPPRDAKAPTAQDDDPAAMPDPRDAPSVPPMPAAAALPAADPAPGPGWLVPSDPAAAPEPHGVTLATGWGGVLFLINALRRLDIEGLLANEGLANEGLADVRPANDGPANPRPAAVAPVSARRANARLTDPVPANAEVSDVGLASATPIDVGPASVEPANVRPASAAPASVRPATVGAAAPTGWRLLHALGRAFGLPEDEPLARFLAEQDLDTEVPPRLLASLHAGLETLYRAAGPWPLPLAQQARLRATETHLDLDLATDSVDLALRLSGLDLDPGWVPWLGRVVAFHYKAVPTQVRRSV